MMRLWSILCVVLALSATSVRFDAALEEGQSPAPCDPGNGGLRLPAGFCATVFADRVGAARHLVVAANGDLYISLNVPDGVSRVARIRPDRPGAGVLVVRDTDKDGHADDEVKVDVVGAATGIALRGSALYVATRTAIARYAIDPDRFGVLGPPETVVTGFPEGGHSSKTIVFDDAGGMFVSVGSRSNACRVTREDAAPDPCPELAERAGIWRYDAERLNQRHPNGGLRWATGVRNGMGLYWHAEWKVLFGTSHGRDSLSSLFPTLFTREKNADTPSEEFFRVSKGADLGWPYCYHDRQLGRKVLAPEYGGDGTSIGRCATITVPLVGFPGHWGPNAMILYTGSFFPARYRNGAFIAFHGSWNRQPLPEDGYNVVFQPMRDGGPDGPFSIFADGFANEKEPMRAAHRPSGLAQGPDGALYVADDMAGRVWRIVYSPASGQ